jgi:TonB family protein
VPNPTSASVPNPTSASVPNQPSASVPNPTSVSVPNQPSASVPAPVEVQGKEVPVRQMQSDPVLAAEARPPVAIHRVVPVVPILLRGQLWNTTVVDVRMSVDASGSVVKAEAVPKPGLHPALRDEAVKAARWWKFQPASFNGHPVPAEIDVRFNFAASR